MESKDHMDRLGSPERELQLGSDHSWLCDFGKSLALSVPQFPLWHISHKVCWENK